MQNKVVIITGASSGIGKALVYEFAKRGAKIAMGARNLDELQKIEKESYERIIRMMSHEVNNSVGAIGSTWNVVADIFKQDENNKWEYVLPAIEASFDRCGHLASFISNLAQVIRIPEPTFSLISLNEQVRSVYALTSAECQQRNIELVLSLTEEDQYIHVDGIQFEQVLVNIIKNAYEAIGKNGKIQIYTHHAPLSIIIEDNKQRNQTETLHPVLHNQIFRPGNRADVRQGGPDQPPMQIQPDDRERSHLIQDTFQYRHPSLIRHFSLFLNKVTS